MTSLLRVAEQHDLDQASDGRSRLGFYLRDYRDQFVFGDGRTDDPVRFALTALKIAIPPTMTPGYVRLHPRVCSLDWHIDGHGCSAVQAVLVAHAPPAVAALTAPWNGWRRVPDVLGGGWYEPDDNSDYTAFAQVTARIPVHDMTLPAPAYDRDGVPNTEVVKASLRQLASQLNGRAQRLLEALES